MPADDDDERRHLMDETATAAANALRKLRAGRQQPIPQVDRSRAPLSFGQRRLWFLDRLAPGGFEYVIPRCLMVEGALDVDALRASFAAVVKRHEVLRSRFRVDRSGMPELVIEPSTFFDCAMIDLAGPAASADLAAGEEVVRKELVRPFVLDEGPLFRVRIVRLGDTRHLVMVAVHHSVADGWSMGLLADEVRRGYVEGVSGQPTELPALPLQYADFAAWQDRRLEETDLSRQMSFWREQLKDLEPLELPLDKPRAAVRSSAGGEVQFRLDRHAVDELREIARKAGATPFMALLTLFQILLSRYCGRSDIAVGTPVAGRPRRELEGLIGFFANTLVIRGDLSGDPSVRESIGRVAGTALDAFANQDVPFERLVDDLAPDRDLSGTPVFQVMFVQDAATEDWSLPGLEVDVLRIAPTAAKFDLTVTVRDVAGEVDVRLEYAAELFTEETITRLGEHYRQLLESAVADPDAPSSVVEMLTAPERAQLLSAANGAAPRDDDLDDVRTRIARWASEAPDAVAVTCGGERLTYRDLDERANRLAHHLRSRGADRGVLVGVCLRRSADLVVAVLAVLRAGAAYVPLDESLPEQRLRFMLDDTAAPLVVTDSAALAGLPAGSWQAICLDADAALIGAQASTPPLLPDGADDLAYVLYTSGSTGTPKGVQVTLGNLGNLLSAMTARFPLAPPDKFLAVTAIAFDISNLEVFLPLVNGAEVVLTESHQLHDMASLVSLLDDPAVKYMQATPSLWRMLPAEIDLSRLHLLVGGEALPLDLARELLARACTVTNLYGPTETTIWSTAALLQPGLDTVPIGKPIANTDVYVITNDGHLAPVGVPGELWIAGAGVARGYLNRPELTREKFVAHPLDPARKAYRTGDFVRWRPDGNLEFLGRKDRQTKIRGHRVELEEIELSLRTHPDIIECVAATHQDAIVAYYLADADLAPARLQAHLAPRLPDYMMPTIFIRLGHVPLTATGKVDRGKLPIPAGRAAGLHRPPRSELEKFIAGLWTEILDPPRPVGITDDFFELGGHSLKAAQLANRIERETGYTISVLEVFSHPTIEAQVDCIRSGNSVTDGLVVDLCPRRSQRVARRNLFCIHPRGGYVHAYRHFGAELDGEFNVIGIQSFDPADPDDLHWSMEDLTEHYWHEIRRVQPTGPYYLLGWCTGGAIVHEMARRRADEVAHIFLLEPVIVDDISRQQYLSSAEAYAEARGLWQLGQSQQGAERAATAAALSALAEPMGLPPEGVSLEITVHYGAMAAEMTALGHHEPAASTVPMTMVISYGARFGVGGMDVTTGHGFEYYLDYWSRLYGGLQIVDVKCRHWEMTMHRDSVDKIVGAVRAIE
ncbi:amino acid adenylation domain-containing protein [Kribbella sp. NPDC020789]